MFVSVEHRTTCTIPLPHDRALTGCDRDGKVSKYLFANEKKDFQWNKVYNSNKIYAFGKLR